MKEPPASESLPPPRVEGAVTPLDYAVPSVPTVQGSVPRVRAIALAASFLAGELLVPAAAATAHVYWYMAPELPGSRVLDAMDRVGPDAIAAVLAAGILFVTLRLRLFAQVRGTKRSPPLVAAAMVGVAQFVVVTAGPQLLKYLPSPGYLTLFLLELVPIVSPVPAAVWLGRRNNRAQDA
jgi:hypothetical protein